MILNSRVTLKRKIDVGDIIKYMGCKFLLVDRSIGEETPDKRYGAIDLNTGKTVFTWRGLGDVREYCKLVLKNSEAVIIRRASYEDRT